MEEGVLYFEEVIPINNSDTINYLEEDILAKGGLRIKILLQNNRIIRGKVFNSFTTNSMQNLFKISEKEIELRKSILNRSFINMKSSQADIFEATSLRVKEIYVPVQTIEYEEDEREYRLYYSILSEQEVRNFIYQADKSGKAGKKKYDKKEVLLTLLLPCLLISDQFEEKVTNKQRKLIINLSVVIFFILIFAINIKQNPTIKVSLLTILYFNGFFLFLGKSRPNDIFSYTGIRQVPLRIYKEIGFNSD